MAKEAQRKMNEKAQRQRKKIWQEQEGTTQATGCQAEARNRRLMMSWVYPAHQAQMSSRRLTASLPQYHPDKNKQPGAEEMFKRINEAYTSSKSSKQDYDRKQSTSNFLMLATTDADTKSVSVLDIRCPTQSLLILLFTSSTVCRRHW